MEITKEWFEKRAAAEGDLEIGAGRTTMTLHLTPEDIATYEKLALEALPEWARKEIEASRANAPTCGVAEMKTSAGSDYFVSVRVGDREITPHMFKERWKAEYEVAEWKWLLNGRDKPDLMAFGPEASREAE